jgi:predicted porin
MKKNAIALAVGALFVAPAANSQTVLGNETVGTVQLYGKLYPQVGYYRSKGGTEGTAADVPATLAKGSRGAGHGSTLSVDSQNTYIGFRGERALGAGMKAIWQVEQAVELDFDDAATWSNRNSFAGLSGGFGTIKLGNMDTIYKEYGDTMSMFGVSSGNFVSASNLLSHIGLGNNRLARFHERAPHSIQYQTPEFGDIQLGVQYSPDEENGTRSQNVSLWSFGVKYDSKLIYLALQHEIHNDFFGGSFNVDNARRNLLANPDDPTVFDTPDASSDSKDRATRFSAEYRMGAHRLVFDIARLKYEEDSDVAVFAGARFRSYERTNWAIGWDARWGGPWRTAIQFLKANEGKCSVSDGSDCSTEGLGATMVTAGVAYYFNRQTLLYGIAAQLRNDKSARFDNWGNGSPFRGADLTQAAVGLSYTF